MLNVCRQHSATSPVGMNPIVPEEHGVVPKQVKIVDEIHFVGGACRARQGMQTKNAAESLRSVAECERLGQR